MSAYIVPFTECGMADVARVGGKNASLGEMISRLSSLGIRVPPGFATTAQAYREFLATDGLDRRIAAELESLDVGDVNELAKRGRKIREAIMATPLPPALAEAVTEAWREVADGPDTAFAVRSSATAEDLPDASFAGQQETLLNVTGIDDVLTAVRRCYTSLFTDRAIHYRAERGYDTDRVGLSVAIQKMVRSGTGCSGVMFTLEPESGFRDVVVINGAWGLGEHLVGGNVDPDEWVVFKPMLGREDRSPIIDRIRGAKDSKMVYARGETSPVKVVETRRRERETYVLDDEEAVQLARWAVEIEDHYGTPMDVEWAKDGETGELFIVQARPETVHALRASSYLETYKLHERGEVIVTGKAVGDRIGVGQVRVLNSPQEIDRFQQGNVLVTETTDPDWEPIMKKAGAIVTERGGRTSHAAIVSRELGVPCIVGAEGAQARLALEDTVTVSCAEGDVGRVYRDELEYSKTEIELETLPEIDTRIMMNVGNPEVAFRMSALPNAGVGLARVEFIIASEIGVHPLALLRYDDLPEGSAKRRIAELTRSFDDKVEFYVQRLAEGISMIAAAFYPNDVIVRLTDFKSNEYANLIGGQHFEPDEENPMLGWRGASRYYAEAFREAFALECRALSRVRTTIGLDNVVVMVPFCRTPAEADRVLAVMADHGLERGRDGLEVYVMCEVPSNVMLAEQFAERFDGFSIGSNDLTQLVLGIDRDSAMLSELFDERDEAVMTAMRRVIEVANRTGTKVGICGQGPSDHPELAEALVEAGIDSISLNPDAVVRTRRALAEIEAQVD